MSKIDSFSEEYFFLSNFYKSEITYDGIKYPTVEHAFQSSKTVDFKKRYDISEIENPGEAKKMGKKVQLRTDWEEIKDSIMKDLIILKFTNPELKKKLIETSDAILIEGNTWNDTYWGVCKGIGENHLGKILMEVRDLLR